MARQVAQKTQPGMPAKPEYLSAAAAAEWDRLVGELTGSNIVVTKAHRPLVEQAARIAADMAEAQQTVDADGAYVLNEKTGVLAMHPAAKRLDSLRRDEVKVLSLLGLRSAFQRPTGDGPKGDPLG